MALTEFEFSGLNAEYCFADGHAYHNLDAPQQAILDRMPEIWMTASGRRQRDLEREFASSFWGLAGQNSAADMDDFRICTSASQSIDMACAWAARTGKKIALMEPCFDNLAQIIRRWGIPLQPVPEALIPDGLGILDSSAFDILFLVTPNNPTGRQLSPAQFTAVARWCAAHDKILFVDFCFRFFSGSTFDFYALLQASGVAYLAIEDTGKTWATLDLKASLIAYSLGLKAELEGIYHEIFLAVSPFTLALLTEFVNDTRARGIGTVLWQLVAEHRRRFREAIADTWLSIEPASRESDLALEWVRIEHPKFDDLAVVGLLRQSGIACLPGRYFHWSLCGDGHRHVRFALLKPGQTFDRGLPVLSAMLRRTAIE